MALRSRTSKKTGRKMTLVRKGGIYVFRMLIIFSKNMCNVLRVRSTQQGGEARMRAVPLQSTRNRRRRVSIKKTTSKHIQSSQPRNLATGHPLCPTSSSFPFLWISFIRILRHISGVQLSCFNTSLKINFIMSFVSLSQVLMSSARIPLLSLALPFLSLLVAA